MSSQPPLGRRYGAAVAIALLGLCPNIVLSTASTSLSEVLQRDLHTSRGLLTITAGMSNAGYAFGAVVAAHLAQRHLQRRLFLGYEAAFVVGSVLAATATGIAPFFAGRVVQGAATGLMLVSALPPLVTRFGVGKLPVTVAIVNVGLFGATTLGPLVGGPVAAAGSWRLLFGLITAVGVLGLVVAAAGYARFDPPDPERSLDKSAISLAAVATVLPFLATSVLAGRSFLSPVFLVPFVVGLGALAALIVNQYVKRDPLMPVKALSTQLPVTGTVVGMVAGAVFVTVLGLTELDLVMAGKQDVGHAGLLFWPMPFGLAVSAVLFGALFRTRWLPVLVDAGLVALGAGTALLIFLDPAAPSPVVPVAALALGFGAGAAVSPALFLAALGVPSTKLGRAFALVELLRSEAAYAVAPILTFVAQSKADLEHGVRVGLVAMLALSGVGLLAALGIPALSGARLRQPDLEAWLDDGKKALPSPTTGVHVRPSREDDEAEPLLPRRHDR